MKIEPANKYTPGDKGYLVYLTLDELLATAAMSGWASEMSNSYMNNNCGWWPKTSALLKNTHLIDVDLMTLLPNPYEQSKIKSGWTPNKEYLSLESEEQA